MNIFKKLPAYTYITIKYHLQMFPQLNNTVTLVTLSLLLSLILVPISVILLGASLVVKKLIDMYLKIKLKHRYRGQIEGVDAVCCNQAACTPSVFLFIDYKKSHNDLRQDFVNLLKECSYSRHEKLFFSWATFMGFHYYYKNALNVDDYVMVSDYDHKISTIRNKQEFADVIIHHDTSAMPDSNRALIHIIIYPQEVALPNVEGCKLVCFKLHHTLADGKALLSWLMTYLVDKDEGIMETTKVVNGNHSSQNNNGVSERKITKNNKPWIDNFASELKQTLLYDKIKALPTDLSEDNILLGKNIIDEKFICWYSDFSSEYIDKIKTIRKSRVGATFLDVINTCISCSLNDYYEKHSPEAPPAIFGGVVLSPANYSFQYGDPDFVLSNEFSLGGISYPMKLNKNGEKPDKNKDILEKFSICQREYEAVKKTVDVKYFYWLSHVFSSVPCQLPTYFSHNLMRITIGVSSLPGTDRTVSVFGGNLVKDMIMMAPNSPGTALHFVNCSYGNQFKLSLTIDKSIERNFDDAQSIIDGIIKYIDCLYEIVLSKDS